jgi:hypothetical protein
MNGRPFREKSRANLPRMCPDLLQVPSFIGLPNAQNHAVGGMTLVGNDQNHAVGGMTLDSSVQKTIMAGWVTSAPRRSPDK